MIINRFLKANIQIIRNEIISELENEFNSHHFLKRFAKRFEANYIEFLSVYKGKGSFRTVHSLIAKFLSENELSLNITKVRKEKSENIFGEIDEIQRWKKL